MPRASCGTVHIVIAVRSALRRVPQDMVSLQTLGVSECDLLAADWLLKCSRVRLPSLDLTERALSRLHSRLVALQALAVDRCLGHIPADWLPRSGRAAQHQCERFEHRTQYTVSTCAGSARRDAVLPAAGAVRERCVEADGPDRARALPDRAARQRTSSADARHRCLQRASASA